MPNYAENIKLVVVGDGGVGKSCLLISYSTGSFPGDYVPTVFDNYLASVRIDGKQYNLGLWDTAGQEDYDRLRPLAYPQTDVFLICFDLRNRVSLNNIESRWIPEINRFCPDTPKLLVGCKSDLRNSAEKIGNNSEIVQHDEGHKMAQRFGMQYCETSALTNSGIEECFQRAIHLAINPVAKHKSRLRGLFSRKNKNKPPVMPPTGKAPEVEVHTSTFMDDMKRLMRDPEHADVVFLLESKHRLKAHKVVLCSGTDYFCEVFAVGDKGKNQLVLHQTQNEPKAGHFSRVHRIYDEEKDDKTGTQTVIEMTPDVKAHYFVYVLKFMYAGVPSFPGDVSEEDLDNVIKLCRVFKLSLLETICKNIKEHNDILNPTVGTYYNETFGQKMKSLFLNKPPFADVIFMVQGEKILAHKCMLSARSDVMEAMFSKSFREGNCSVAELDIADTSVEAFLSLLEYLYTDHSPTEDIDSVGLLILANRYCQMRLVTLCELYITKEVDRALTKNIEKSDIDVVGLLLASELHNAGQLEKWCLFFIASNYTAFEKRKEFILLEGKHKQYVEDHRWPPVSYLKEVEQYEREMAKHGEKCMVM